MSLLQRRGLLTLGFDRAGTSNASLEDQQSFKEAERLRAAGSGQWQQPILRTKWFQTYCGGAVKKALCVLAQSGRRGIEVVCIHGGPVTQVEHQMMPRLLEDAAADALKSGVVVRTNMRTMSYRDFHAVARSFIMPGGGGGSDSSSDDDAAWTSLPPKRKESRRRSAGAR